MARAHTVNLSHHRWTFLAFLLALVCLPQHAFGEDHAVGPVTLTNSAAVAVGYSGPGTLMLRYQLRQPGTNAHIEYVDVGIVSMTSVGGHADSVTWPQVVRPFPFRAVPQWKRESPYFQSDYTNTPTVDSVPFTPPPTITSALTASGTIGEPWSYQITATGSPTSFGASPLPPDFTFNAETGEIAGTPVEGGTWNIEISATNAQGTDTKVLVLTVDGECNSVSTWEFQSSLGGGMLREFRAVYESLVGPSVVTEDLGSHDAAASFEKTISVPAKTLYYPFKRVLQQRTKVGISPWGNWSSLYQDSYSGPCEVVPEPGDCEGLPVPPEFEAASQVAVPLENPHNQQTRYRVVWERRTFDGFLKVGGDCVAQEKWVEFDKEELFLAPEAVRTLERSEAFPFRGRVFKLVAGEDEWEEPIDHVAGTNGPGPDEQPPQAETPEYEAPVVPDEDRPAEVNSTGTLNQAQEARHKESRGEQAATNKQLETLIKDGRSHADQAHSDSGKLEKRMGKMEEKMGKLTDGTGQPGPGEAGELQPGGGSEIVRLHAQLATSAELVGQLAAGFQLTPLTTDANFTIAFDFPPPVGEVAFSTPPLLDSIMVWVRAFFALYMTYLFVVSMLNIVRGAFAG